MLTSDFIKAIESYYGKYRPAVKVVVTQYLQAVSESELPEIRKQLLLTVSGRYDYVPDVATIEQARKEIKRARPTLPEYIPMGREQISEEFNPDLGGLLKGLIKKLKKPGKKND